MRKRWMVVGAIASATLIGLVAVPVAVRQWRTVEKRALVGAKLADTDYREVHFRNAIGGIELAGMLFVPAGEGPFPAAVVIHGSGASRRDNAWYLTLCTHLQRSGVAVLLPDKRGSEQSQGEWRTASLEALAGDTVAAVEYLRRQTDVPLAKTGIIGMSQGGHIAPLVADRAGNLDFVVNVVGGAVPLREGLAYEENHNLRQLGFLPGVSNFVAMLSTAYLVHHAQKDFWDAIGQYDPLPFWRQLAVPALVLYGQDDTNVDTAESAALVRTLDKPNIEVVVYEGSGHALEEPEGKGNAIFRQDALNRIGAFIENAP